MVTCVEKYSGCLVSVITTHIFKRNTVFPCVLGRVYASLIIYIKTINNFAKTIDKQTEGVVLLL